MIALLKQTLQPASITCLLALLAIGLAMSFWSVLARWGRRWLVAVFIGYWALSTPACAAGLAWTLTNYQPLQHAADAPGAQAIVMLGAGSLNIRALGFRYAGMTPGSTLRALETARLYRLLGHPLVVVSGGVTENDAAAAPESDAFREAMLTLGVPADRIVMESESKNTRDEAVVIKRMFRERGIDRFVLVTSPMHMWRSLAVFASVGLHPVPSAAPLHGDSSASPFSLIPNDASLQLGNAAIYEWVARFYYWRQGWIPGLRPVALAK